MLDYDCYIYMYALQKGWVPYKADGTGNFDDPLFKESLEFYYGLGNTEKIQPSIPDGLTAAARHYLKKSLATATQPFLRQSSKRASFTARGRKASMTQ